MVLFAVSGLRLPSDFYTDSKRRSSNAIVYVEHAGELCNYVIIASAACATLQSTSAGKLRRMLD